MDAKALKKTRTTREITEVIQNLSPADRARLLSTAGYYSAKARLMPEELLQMALVKAFQGKRLCPSNVAPVTFFRGVMKSLANNEYKKRKRRIEAGFVEITNDNVNLVDNFTDPSPPPDEALILSSEETQFYDSIEEAFINDEKGHMVLLGIFDGLKGRELCDAAGVSKSELVTIHKRIKRKSAKLKSKEH